MQVTAVETIRLGEFPNIIWLRVHTDDGLVGLGETFSGAAAVEAYVHETVAPYLLGKDPLQIDRHARALYGYLGYRSSGVEMRGNSALDIALWDLLGKVAGLPVYQLLGGLSRERVRIYNTCAGYRYIRAESRQAVDNWGLPAAAAGSDPDVPPDAEAASALPSPLPQATSPGPYEDLEAFLTDAGELARSLLAQGVTGMKIWPFDPYAEQTGGTHISARDLDEGLEPFRKIRAAVGDEMDVMVEFHSLWNLPTAIKIAKALEPFSPYWFEDPLKADNLDALATFAAATHVPTTVSETLSTRWSFREAMQAKAAGVVMLDLSWVGGIGEAKKIAAMAEAHQLPVAPHDCTGPVVLQASTHLSLNAPNALVQETVRAFTTGWYRELVTHLPVIEGGYASLPPLPGLGTELLPGLTDRPDATVRVSRVS